MEVLRPRRSTKHLEDKNMTEMTKQAIEYKLNELGERNNTTTVTFSGTTTISGTATISGATTLSGATTISGNVALSGDTTVTGAINVTGLTTAADNAAAVTAGLAVGDVYIVTATNILTVVTA